MFFQRCQSQYDYNQYYQTPYYTYQLQNPASQPVRYFKNMEVHNPRVNSRYRDSDSSNSERRDEKSSSELEKCKCSCKKCNKLKACCFDFYNNCPKSVDNIQSCTYPPYYNYPPHSDIAVIQYAIPMVFYLSTTDKQAVNTDTTVTLSKTTFSTKSTTMGNTEETISEPGNHKIESYETDTTRKIIKTTGLLVPEKILIPKKENMSIKDSETKTINKKSKIKKHSKKKPSTEYHIKEKLAIHKELKNDDEFRSSKSGYDVNLNRQEINITMCKNVAKCYSRNWNNNSEEPIKLFIEAKSKLMPLVRLRPMKDQVKFRRTIDPTSNTTPQYNLKALNDKFAKILMNDLENKQVLVLQKNYD